ncbi:MAG: phosphoenolpyruvate synthase [Candidatus Pacebacteria bacterium]|nr:phosphoenolpyruvate synthase [Candidatus Paceibacterota bacterium]
MTKQSMDIKTIKYILWFEEISKKDIAIVGGKNASLGEMYSSLREKGVNVPNGFALTAQSFWYFLKANNIDQAIKDLFAQLNPNDIESIRETGKKVRGLVSRASFPDDLEQEILDAYHKLSAFYAQKYADVAIRSSATAEDLKGASFAGAMETYLNIKGDKNVLEAIQKCITSLYTDRAIAYREAKGFDHTKIALSAGIIKMVRSDLASSGIMFTLDTETGFPNIVLINSIYGIGELIVKGRITPDEFFVFKPTLQEGFEPIIVKNLGRKNYKYVYSERGGIKNAVVPRKKQLEFSLTESEILKLAKWAMTIEEHYGEPQDIEWAKDGKTGELFIVQSRPETVQSMREKVVFEEYQLQTDKKPVIKGIAVGSKIGVGKAKIIQNINKIATFTKGDILVTKMTDPDWVPIMRLASAIVTDEGGRVCHAAIVSRELGIPCIVGTKNGSKVLKTGQMITADCSSGFEGRVYLGELKYEKKEYDLKQSPVLPVYPVKSAEGGAEQFNRVKIMVNIGSPDMAFKACSLPQEGAGLAREEFIIAEKIKVHPMALHYFDNLKSPGLAKAILAKYNKEIPFLEIKKIVNKIEQITVEHKDKKEYFVKELAEGIGQIACAFFPKPVIVRFSDFKTNEYAQLIGGAIFEPKEENPMMGFRGASRYYDEKFKPAFLMECSAIKRARNVFGLKNIKLMIPFCRTVEEGKKVLEIMEMAGLKRGEDGLEVYVMCEIPSNIILAEQFLEIFDGMSIGSNDLTQLTLGLDRDNGTLAHIGNEQNEAVKDLLRKIIKICREKNKYCGICGQAPSDFPEFAEFLMQEGIESISLNPDTVIKTILQLSKIN